MHTFSAVSAHGWLTRTDVRDATVLPFVVTRERLRTDQSVLTAKSVLTCSLWCLIGFSVCVHLCESSKFMQGGELCGDQSDRLQTLELHLLCAIPVSKHIPLCAPLKQWCCAVWMCLKSKCVQRYSKYKQWVETAMHQNQCYLNPWVWTGFGVYWCVCAALPIVFLFVSALFSVSFLIIPAIIDCVQFVGGLCSYQRWSSHLSACTGGFQHVSLIYLFLFCL